MFCSAGVWCVESCNRMIMMNHDHCDSHDDHHHPVDHDLDDHQDHDDQGDHHDH